MLCALGVDLVDCMLPEAALGVAAFGFEVILGEGTIVVVVGSFLAGRVSLHLQILHFC